MDTGKYSNAPPPYQPQPQVTVQNTQQNNTTMAQPQPYYPPPAPVYQPPPQQYYPPPPMMQSSQQSNTTVVLQQPQTVVTTIIAPPHDYMCLSIFSCLCCFWPLGLVAIIFSSMVANRYTVGDYEGATIASLRARNCAYLAIFIGIAGGILCVIMFAAVANSNE